MENYKMKLETHDNKTWKTRNFGNFGKMLEAKFSSKAIFEYVILHKIDSVARKRYS